MRLLATCSSFKQKSRSRFISAISAGVLACMLLRIKYSFVLIMSTMAPPLLLPGEVSVGEATLSPLPEAAISRIEATLFDRAGGELAFQKDGRWDRLDRNDDTERSAETGILKGRAVGLVAVAVELAGLDGRGGNSGVEFCGAMGGLRPPVLELLEYSLASDGGGDS